MRKWRNEINLRNEFETAAKYGMSNNTGSGCWNSKSVGMSVEWERERERRISTNVKLELRRRKQQTNPLGIKMETINFFHCISNAEYSLGTGKTNLFPFFHSLFLTTFSMFIINTCRHKDAKVLADIIRFFPFQKKERKIKNKTESQE